jgi:hypothetical protein
VDIRVDLVAPPFSQNVLAYLIATAIATVSAGNLVLLGLISAYRGRSA